MSKKVKSALRQWEDLRTNKGINERKDMRYIYTSYFCPVVNYHDKSKGSGTI